MLKSGRVMAGHFFCIRLSLTSLFEVLPGGGHAQPPRLVRDGLIRLKFVRLGERHVPSPSLDYNLHAYMNP